MPAFPTLKLYDGTATTNPQFKPAILELQKQLQARGYRMRFDGEYGVYTENCVKLFQQSRGLAPNGVCGPETWAILIPPVNPTPAGGSLRFATPYSKDDKFMLQELEQFRFYQPIVAQVALQCKVPTAVIAGMGSRESRWGLALTPPGPAGSGDGGHGRGLLQVDDRPAAHAAHISSGDWMDPAKHIAYGGQVLRWMLGAFAKECPNAPADILLRGGIAGYNKGPRRVIDAYKAGLDVDTPTALGNYSKNTLERAGWFQLHGI